MTDKTPLTHSNSNEEYKYAAVFDSRNGSKNQREEFAQETILGECRNLKRVSWVEWLFMVVATLSLLGVLGITIERVVFFKENFTNLTIMNETAPAPCDSWVCTNDFIFTVVLLVNIGFCMFYCYDGLLRERPFEILAYVAAVVVIIVYIIVNFIINGSESQPLRIARLVLVCVFGPLNIFLALWSWKKMGYFVLNVIGTNSSLIRAYRIRSFFQTAQFFHVELLCNLFVLAWAQDGQFLELWEKVFLCVLLFYTVCVTAVGGAAILWEIKWLAYAWYGFISPCGGYYLFKLIEVSINFKEYQVEYEEYPPENPSELTYVNLLYVGSVLLFVCIFGLVVVAVLLIFMTLSLMNFGKGLKNKIHPPLYRYLPRRSMN